MAFLWDFLWVTVRQRAAAQRHQSRNHSNNNTEGLLAPCNPFLIKTHPLYWFWILQNCQIVLAVEQLTEQEEANIKLCRLGGGGVVCANKRESAPQNNSNTTKTHIRFADKRLKINLCHWWLNEVRNDGKVSFISAYLKGSKNKLLQTAANSATWSQQNYR